MCSGLDAEFEQTPLDPLGPPVVERAAILGERAGVARVVDVALAQQRLDRALDRRLVDIPGRQMAAHLGLGAVAFAQVAVAEIERALQPSLRVERARVAVEPRCIAVEWSCAGAERRYRRP